MKIAYLTSGPRGCGKSTYVSFVKAANPDVVVIDRDRFYIDKFGATSFDPYTGEGDFANKLFIENLKEVVTAADKNAKIIIDAWNGYPHERQDYINLLRELKVEAVICWYFVVSLASCIKWCQQKTDYHGSEISATRDYELHHKTSQDLWCPEEFYQRYVNEGKPKFDAIRYIDPLQLVLPGFPLI